MAEEPTNTPGGFKTASSSEPKVTTNTQENKRELEKPDKQELSQKPRGPQERQTGRGRGGGSSAHRGRGRGRGHPRRVPRGHRPDESAAESSQATTAVEKHHHEQKPEASDGSTGSDSESDEEDEETDGDEEESEDEDEEDGIQNNGSKDEPAEATTADQSNNKDSSSEVREKKQPYVRQVELPKEKPSAAELDAKMAAMAITNAKLLERKKAADQDAAEYHEIERESQKKYEAQRLQQQEIDEIRRAAANRKLGKVQGREWDLAKTEEDWNNSRPYVDRMTNPHNGGFSSNRRQGYRGPRTRGTGERGRGFPRGVGRGRGKGKDRASREGEGHTLTDNNNDQTDTKTENDIPANTAENREDSGNSVNQPLTTTA